MDDFGQLLQTARIKAGMSLRALEKRTGLSNAFLSQLENHADTHPSFESAILLAEVLQVDLNNMGCIFMDSRAMRG